MRNLTENRLLSGSGMTERKEEKMKKVLSVILAVMMVFTTFSATISVQADDVNTQKDINGIELYSKAKPNAIYGSTKVGALAVKSVSSYNGENDENISKSSVKVVKAYYVKGHKKNWYSQKKTTDKKLVGKYDLVVVIQATGLIGFGNNYTTLSIFDKNHDGYFSDGYHEISNSKRAFYIGINANEITKSGITYQLKGKSFAVSDVNEKTKNARIPESIKIGSKKYSVKSIEQWSFTKCDKLKKINVDKKNKYLTSVDGVLFNKNKTALIRYPAGKTAKSYTVPKGVKKIASFAFLRNKYLKNVTIPKSVKTIDSEAFGADYGENSRYSNYTLKTITFEKGSKLKSFDLSYIGYGDYDDGFYVGKRFTHTTIKCFDKRIVKMVKKQNKEIQKNYGYKNCFKIKYKK